MQVFEASSSPVDAGGALSLAPNAMNVLAAAGAVEQVRDVSVTADEWAFKTSAARSSSACPPETMRNAGRETSIVRFLFPP